MAGLAIGIYGKLPSHADFVSVNVDSELTAELYDWMQTVIFKSKEVMSDSDWLTAYLVSPIWRFYLPVTEHRKGAVTGIMLPSVDSVGRYFPIFLLFKLDTEKRRTEWLFREATTLLEVLENAGIQALQKRLTVYDLQVLLDEFTADFEVGEQLMLPIETPKSVINVDEQLDKMIVQLGDVTLWWSMMDINGHVKPLCSFSQMPDANDYQFMLVGSVSE
ncbi:type VI secretion system-associated protein TagF [Neptunomonas sp.]|uniref:type VI secretion system-associated protein TagF n=1 Tax=Neptunomonas TaxID=75687 RepID=UPI003511964E